MRSGGRAAASAHSWRCSSSGRSGGGSCSGRRLTCPSISTTCSSSSSGITRGPEPDEQRHRAGSAAALLAPRLGAAVARRRVRGDGRLAQPPGAAPREGRRTRRGDPLDGRGFPGRRAAPTSRRLVAARGHAPAPWLEDARAAVSLLAAILLVLLVWDQIFPFVPRTRLGAVHELRLGLPARAAERAGGSRRVLLRLAT